jgi:hypothetical protein
LKPIVLLKPKLDKGKSLLKALWKRQTIREVSDKKLSLQVLSNMLWAACGVNRKRGPFGLPGCTAASDSNSQEMDVYVAMKKGAYLYGLIAGNVYLFAASQGMAAWFHYCDKPALAAKLNLRGDQRVVFGQTVGYPLK